MKDFVTPIEIFEEYLARAIMQIERGGREGFRAAVRELVDFHSFHLKTMSSVSSDGRLQNYSELPTFFTHDFEEWNRRYHDIHVRVASQIEKEAEYVEITARIPMMLIDHCGQEVTPKILASFLDQNLSLFHRIEDWFGARSSAIDQGLPDIANPLTLKGFDGRTHERVIRNFIGAFESPLELTSLIWAWDSSGEDAELRWSRLSQSSTFIFRHLQNTVYLLTTAIWRGDRFAASLMADALMRWAKWYDFTLESDYLSVPSTFNPDIFKLSWAEIDVLLAEPQMARMHARSPESVARAILDHLISDIQFLVCALLLNWIFRFNKTQNLAVEVYRQLFWNQSFDPDVNEDESSGTRFSTNSSFQNLLRLTSANIWSDKQNYEAWLENTIRSSDGLTERDVVPGRIYHPTTLNDVEGLSFSFVILFMVLAATKDEKLSEQSKQMLRDASWPRADINRATFVIRWLTDLKRYTDELPEDDWYRVFEIARSQTARNDLRVMYNIREGRERASNLFSDALEFVEQERAARLARLPVSQERLTDFAKHASHMLPTLVPVTWFRRFSLVETEYPQENWRLGQYPKGRLTKPPMESLASNELEHYSNRATTYLGHTIIKRAFSKLNVISVNAATSSDFYKSFREQELSLLDAGLSPLLIVESRARPAWVRSWLRHNADDRYELPPGLQVRHDALSQIDGYLGTLNETPVVELFIEAGASFLVAKEAFQSVEFSLLGNEALLPTDVTFDAQDGENFGVLKFSWAYSVDLSPYDVLRLVSLPENER